MKCIQWFKKVFKTVSRLSKLPLTLRIYCVNFWYFSICIDVSHLGNVSNGRALSVLCREAACSRVPLSCSWAGLACSSTKYVAPQQMSHLTPVSLYSSPVPQNTQMSSTPSVGTLASVPCHNIGWRSSPGPRRAQYMVVFRSQVCPEEQRVSSVFVVAQVDLDRDKSCWHSSHRGKVFVSGWRLHCGAVFNRFL